MRLLSAVKVGSTSVPIATFAVNNPDPKTFSLSGAPNVVIPRYVFPSIRASPENVEVAIVVVAVKYDPTI